MAPKRLGVNFGVTSDFSIFRPNFSGQNGKVSSNMRFIEKVEDSDFRNPQLFYALLRFVGFSSLVENTPPRTFAALAFAIAIWWA